MKLLHSFITIIPLVSAGSVSSRKNEYVDAVTIEEIWEPLQFREKIDSLTSHYTSPLLNVEQTMKKIEENYNDIENKYIMDMTQSLIESSTANYKIIGCGSNACVFKVQLPNKTTVAVKCYEQSSEKSWEEEYNRYKEMREIKDFVSIMPITYGARRLDKKYKWRFLDDGYNRSINFQHFIVQEHFDGDLLDNQSKLEALPSMFATMVKVAHELAILHDQGFYHSDVKWENTLVNDVNVKLCDFETVCKLGNPDKLNKGTVGCLFPQFWEFKCLQNTRSQAIENQKWQLTTKKDSWAFGTAVIQMMKLHAEKKRIGLGKFDGWYERLFDGIIEQNYNHSEFQTLQTNLTKAVGTILQSRETEENKKFIDLLISIFHLDINQRPTMTEVAKKLREIYELDVKAKTFREISSHFEKYFQ